MAAKMAIIDDVEDLRLTQLPPCPLTAGVFLDSLHQSLQASVIGCWIGPHCFTALAYAGDVTLLTIAGLRRILEICEWYSEWFEIKFNPKKTVCLAFTR